MQDLDDLLRVSNGAWAQAARGEVPLIVAAAVTSTAFEEFKGVKQQLKMLCDADDFDDASKKIESISRRLSSSPDSCTDSTLMMLLRYWHAMNSLKMRGPARVTVRENTATTKPNSVSAVNRLPALDQDNEFGVIVQGIVHHLCIGSDSVSTFHSTCSPSVQIHSFLVGLDTDGLSASFGLWLLHSSCQSYSAISSDKQLKFECRIKALGFAQGALSSVNSVLEHATLPCRCPNTLAFHLEGVRANIQSYVQAKHFDGYFRSPWVAGAQVHGMLEELFYYGLRLFTYRNYVGSVLHLSLIHI